MNAGAVAVGAAPLLLTVDEDTVKPGLLGFVVVMAMAVALYFLLRSMAKHLRRVDVDRESGPDTPAEPKDPDST